MVIKNALTLTLVIPVFNEEDTIRDCLECAARQTQPFDEIIVVDNNSTDRTVELAAGYASRLPLSVVHEPRQGVLWARETGFAAANGDYIARIDADTQLHPQWVARMRRHLNANPDTVAINGLSYMRDTPFTDRNLESMTKLAMSTERGRQRLDAQDLSGNNMLIRKSAWRAAQPFLLKRTDLHEDIDLFFAVRQARCGSLSFLPSALASVSPRRLYDPLRATHKYRKATIRTIAAHGDDELARKMRRYMPSYLAWIAVFKLIGKPYDPIAKKWRPFRRTHTRRVSPITHISPITR